MLPFLFPPTIGGHLPLRVGPRRQGRAGTIPLFVTTTTTTTTQRINSARKVESDLVGPFRTILRASQGYTDLLDLPKFDATFFFPHRALPYDM